MRGLTRLLAALLCLCVLLAADFAAAESGGKAEDITKRCTFKVSEGSRSRLTDDSVRSTWTYSNSGAYIGVKLPDGVQAGWLRIEWMFDPTGFQLREYDASQNLLRQRDQSDTFPNIYTVMELLPETAYIQIKMTAKDQEVCTVRVYSAGKLPGDVQVWNPPVAKADIMVVSTHQDDELIFLGGTIPYYATALKKPTVVVYMANCTRYRRNEALNALWKMGVRDYPEFINLRDKRTSTLKEAVELWGGKDNILSLLVERIRRFKPEVIVTQDLNGEYGHNQHKTTARAMKYAIDAAADASQYPESAGKYGAWQVKKLYHHLYKENQIEMDWETPLDALHGYSPLKVAQIGMDEHASQLKYYRVKSHGKYDNSKFGLYFSTVGEDVAKNDFLENIDPNATANYLAAHPEALEQARVARTAVNVEPEEAEEDVPEEIGAEAGEETGLEFEAGDAAEEAALPEGLVADAPDETAALPEGLAADAPEPADSLAADAAEVSAEPAEADEVLSEPVDAVVPEVDAELGEHGVAPDANVEPGEQGVAPEPGAPEPEPPAANERGGGAGPAVALAAVGVAALGAGGWYGYRSLNRRRHRRRGRARR